ncbi:MAG: hypothetical protein NXY57DRAFT_1062831 [Lentinula lateritia]|nr:MAG: hypothetical protein NXY57DRAFT_1062831 [Lentinula lateritia]
MVLNFSNDSNVKRKRKCGQAIRSQVTVRVTELVLGEEVPLTIETLKLVNCDLANSLTKLLTIAPADKQPPLNDELALIEETVTVEAPVLDSTLPGYDIELKAILSSGSTLEAKAFREGYSKVFSDWRSTGFHCGGVGDVWEWG